MTENQLKYLAYQESVRHNTATEADASRKTDETERSNRANESLKSESLAETKRSNQANESLKSTEITTKAAIEASKVVPRYIDAFIPG